MSEDWSNLLDSQKLKRGVLKTILSPLLSWSPLDAPREGFSIVLGVPWALRHLLPVNLQFVQRTDLGQLDRIYIVFDRTPQVGANAFIAQIKQSFPNLLLNFSFHPPIAGRFVRLINQSKFYASMNWTLGLGQCETRYAILHDFDLYPLVPTYFTSMVNALRDRALRFTGIEWTHFDGLESSNALIGTWALGVDVAWLRQHYRPIDCFHTVDYISGRRFDLDAFTFIQSTTPERGLVGVVTGDHLAHVRNLCSTYLRFSKGERVDVVWRLHYLWYLEAVCGNKDRLEQLVCIMNEATSSQLCVDESTVEFAETHVTCANVLRTELIRMERFLFERPRLEVVAYIDAFEEFLWRYGRSDPIVDKDGSVIWSADAARSQARLPVIADQ